MVIDAGEPESYEEALDMTQKKEGTVKIYARRDEFLAYNNTYDLVEKPKH